MKAIAVPADSLLRFCAACFRKLGVPSSNALLTAKNLVFANLRGVDSHGVIRLKIYVDRLRAGGFKAKARPVVVAEKKATALIEARHGLGQVAGNAAMKLAITKAKKSGMAVVSIKNSNHFGACAFYAM